MAEKSSKRKVGSPFIRAVVLSLRVRDRVQFWRWLGEAGLMSNGNRGNSDMLTFKSYIAEHQFPYLKKGALLEEVLRA